MKSTALVLLLCASGCSGHNARNADSTAAATAGAPERSVSTLPVATPSSGRDSTLFRVMPGQRFGAVTASVSQADLARLFGIANVSSVRVQCAEDSCNEPGTMVKVPGCPETLRVFWVDTVALRQPSTIEASLRFDQYDDLSLRGCWRTEQGLGIGTTLRDLEALNQGPFQVSPLGEWDYAGYVGPWLGGRLSNVLQPASGRWIGLRLNFLSNRGLSPSEFEKISKPDRDSLRSDEPLLRKLNPRIVELTMSFVKEP
jgi:hypothetical protein